MEKMAERVCMWIELVGAGCHNTPRCREWPNNKQHLINLLNCLLYYIITHTTKTFANSHKISKFTKMFSLKSFPLYSIT